MSTPLQQTSTLWLLVIETHGDTLLTNSRKSGILDRQYYLAVDEVRQTVKKGTDAYRLYMHDYMREYRKRDPEKIRRQRRAADWRRRGIVDMTWDRFLLLLEYQENSCAICGRVI